MVDAGAPQEVALPGRPYPPPARGEQTWPIFVSVLLTIALQYLLPSRVAAGPDWLVPVFEVVLFGGLVAATPRQLRKEHPRRRRLALILIALVSAANAASLTLLTRDLVEHGVSNGRQLIFSGALIWLTNVVIFGLWYWEADRGGPGVRAAGHDRAPDFLFPQMNDDRIQPVGWRPQYIDYLYLSLTNAIAFSPTDTMPLTPLAKSLMGLQSLISLVTIALVLSRAVNILQG